MANRSYLYALDTLPVPGAPRPPAPGISEWRWAIPLAHKVLLSGSPRLVPSMIWDGDGDPDSPNAVLALAGDYDTGVANLTAFMQGLPHPEAAAKAAEALAFLNDPANRKRYLWLEAAEIFDMLDEPLRVQAEGLLAEVSDDWTGYAASVPADQLDQATGSGSWSRILYYGPFD